MVTQPLSAAPSGQHSKKFRVFTSQINYRYSHSFTPLQKSLRFNLCLSLRWSHRAVLNNRYSSQTGSGSMQLKSHRQPQWPEALFEDLHCLICPVTNAGTGMRRAFERVSQRKKEAKSLREGGPRWCCMTHRGHLLFKPPTFPEKCILVGRRQHCTMLLCTLGKKNAFHGKNSCIDSQ